ncbi:uncharacterized protein METZ01_LOCUS210046 [marine metagenome]|uniref:Uncharacterized protein n=1 Tax=marine metagenome TaxID=408172 RepID=A0A382F3I5_9ZZZZ
MPNAVRIGDANGAGGKVTQGAFTVMINSKPVCTHSSKVTPHRCCGAKGCDKHCTASTTKGSRTVIAGGRPVVYKGVPDTCGHRRKECSPNVVVGA